MIFSLVTKNGMCIGLMKMITPNGMDVQNKGDWRES